MDTKLKVLFHVPNISILRQSVAKLRICSLKRRMLPESIISEAEASFAYKERISAECVSRSKARFLKTEPLISGIIRERYSDLSQAEQERIRTDMTFCFFAYGFQPDEYLFFGLKDKHMPERQTYVSDVERTIYFMQMNDICEGEVFLDKSKTYRVFKEFYKRDAVLIDQHSSYSSFEQFVDAHPVFVRKRVDLSKGDGVELIDTLQEKLTKRELFESLRASNVYQLEELIQQSAVMQALNKSSVNTIRCNAFVTHHGVEVPFTFLKVGRAGSFVDNGGKGGILIGVDEKTGVLNTDGMDEHGNVFTEHPESHIPFKGYQLPNWQQMLQLCNEITPRVKGIHAIGWDLAHTDQGWVIVEGNLFSQFIGPQITKERGLKTEFLEIMKDMDLITDYNP